jgi:heat shock protein HspQ
MSQHLARFAVGQLVDHRLFGYRGVVFDVDANFELDDEWYEQMAQSRPPKDQPWYHVLVHDSDGTTYVAERNLEAASSPTPVRHALLDRFFRAFADGRYAPRVRLN